MNAPKKVLVVCTHNSARSRMAEALLRSECGERFDVMSAGIDPREVRPEAVDVMNEIGIDIAGSPSTSITELVDRAFDIIIFVCSKSREECGGLIDADEVMAWDVDDPTKCVGDEEQRLEEFRRVRDEIMKRIRYFTLTDRQTFTAIQP